MRRKVPFVVMMFAIFAFIIASSPPVSASLSIDVYADNTVGEAQPLQLQVVNIADVSVSPPIGAQVNEMPANTETTADGSYTATPNITANLASDGAHRARSAPMKAAPAPNNRPPGAIPSS